MDPLWTGPSPQATRAASVLRSAQEQIVRRWSELVATHVKPARSLPGKLLRDHMPALVEQLAVMLEQGAPSDELLTALPTTHALERLDEGFDLAEVTTEYRLLRRAIVEALVSSNTEVDHLTVLRLHDALDRAVTLSAHRYANARARTLSALDRITQAVSSVPDISLDRVAPELLRVLMETTASVDSVALLLREGERLRVAAVVGENQRLVIGQVFAMGECVAGAVAQTREPLLVRDASSDARFQTDPLASLGTHALYAVPLMLADKLVGVTVMGSRSSYFFSDEDLLLFRALCNRLSGLVLKAQLYAGERARREELERAEEILEAGEAFFVMDHDYRIIRVNEAQERLSKTPRGTSLGRTFWELWPDAAAPDSPYRQHYARAMRERIPVRFEAHFPPLDLWTDVSVFPTREGGLAVFFRDVTKRKRDEAMIRESRDRLELALASANLGTVEARTRDGQVLLDKRAVDLLGLGGSASAVPLETVFAQVAIDDLPAVRAAIDAAIGAPAANGFFEVEFRTRTTAQRWLSLSAQVFRTSGGEADRIVGVLVDHTEHRHEEEFRERFLGIVSHDLRNPLTTISASASLLLRAPDVPETQRRALTRVASSAERMNRMIADLLDFTRGRLGGGIPIVRQRMSLRHLARHIAEDQELVHPERRVLVTAQGNFEGEWDHDRLAQLLTNLVENAIRYSDERTPVQVHLADEGERVVIRVRNQGPPIPPSLQPHIFDPFRRGADQELKPREGLGLGLFIAKLVVEAHQGEIAVRSDADHGTEFSIRLPRGGQPKAVEP